MNTKLTLGLSVITLCLAALHTLFACAGSEDPALVSSALDASADGLYSGGGSVIPSGDPDALSTYGGHSGYGYGYGSTDGAIAPCPRDAASDTLVDASEDGAVADAGMCLTDIGPGDLIIDELMIASQSGAGDHGEWMEVASTRDCVIDLKGVYAEVPHGKGTTTASITDDVLLPPHGFFLIADSDQPSVNNNLPGSVFVWGSGTSSDVLLNSGDTITLYTASATIDVLTYPDSSKLVDGTSMAFPADCAPSLRLEFGNWQDSIASWTPGFFGTPAAPNTDVSCAVAPPTPPPSSPCGS
jgi:hypothetical protein